ncbi:MAG: electron transport complex subunit RsxC [Thomasclavelia sp.]|jgi:electron transport complex protein RnfC|nr:electron transport complex subunit RsxC [Thomasclavelia sp.]
MHLKTFKGGIHPFEGKGSSKDKPIKEIADSDEMVFPLSQHIGGEAKPLVQKGDYVKRGQTIGQINGFISSNIVSSVSGTVKSIEPRLTASGIKVDSIIIENDHQDIENFVYINRDYKNLSRKDILRSIEDAGIVGLGGAGFPTHVKVNPKDYKDIKYLLINGAECEPYLTSDYRMMLEMSEDIINGIEIELSLFPNAQAIIGIEDNKPDAIEALQKATQNHPKITIQTLKTKYPQGGERSLIYVLTGKKIYSKMLPSDVGVIVDNIATLKAINDAVIHNLPLMNRILTFTGDAIKNPCNLLVRIGTSYKEILDNIGGLKCEASKMISGGPMMGNALFSLEIPVTKNSSSLLCLSEDEVSLHEPTACIHCGRCVEVCPSRIVPQLMYKYALKSDREGFLKVDGMECIECGCCTYVCPAKRNMTQSFKKIKRQIASSNRKKA